MKLRSAILGAAAIVCASGGDAFGMAHLSAYGVKAWIKGTRVFAGNMPGILSFGALIAIEEARKPVRLPLATIAFAKPIALFPEVKSRDSILFRATCLPVDEEVEVLPEAYRQIFGTSPSQTEEPINVIYEFDEHPEAYRFEPI
jgi:hypothetical protein